MFQQITTAVSMAAKHTAKQLIVDFLSDPKNRRAIERSVHDGCKAALNRAWMEIDQRLNRVNDSPAIAD